MGSGPFVIHVKRLPLKGLPSTLICQCTREVGGTKESTLFQRLQSPAMSQMGGQRGTTSRYYRRAPITWAILDTSNTVQANHSRPVWPETTTEPPKPKPMPA